MVGVQVSTPVSESSVIPAGADTRLKVSVLAGRSGSVAVLVTTSVASPWIALYDGTVSTGALFASAMIMVKLLVALSDGVPLSVTMVVNVAVLGPCASLGVQAITPLALMLAPAGGDTN